MKYFEKIEIKSFKQKVTKSDVVLPNTTIKKKYSTKFETEEQFIDICNYFNIGYQKFDVREDLEKNNFGVNIKEDSKSSEQSTYKNKNKVANFLSALM